MQRTCLRNVNDVNKFELHSVYEYICITQEFPMHFHTAKLHVSRLFNSIIFYEQHLLHWLLPERHYTNYNLISRRHDRTLLTNTDRSNFIHRMILKICTSLTVILLGSCKMRGVGAECRELAKTKMRGVCSGEYVRDVVKIAGCGVCR